MTTTTTNCRSRIDGLKGQRDQALASLTILQKETKRLTRRQGHIDKAKVVLRLVAAELQEQLKYHISEIGTLALSAVFDDPYELLVDFVERRGKTECDIWLVDTEGNRLDPKDATGGGVVDVVSFALRIALWSLLRPKKRALLILDEPFRFLSADLRPKAAEMLKEISRRLGIQILMVTHSEILAEAGERTFLVGQRNGISQIEQESKTYNE